MSIRKINMVTPVAERLMRHIERSNGCWKWIGYPQIRDDSGRSRPARLMSWLAAGGDEPIGKTSIYTTCGNNACVNPAHMEIGRKRDHVPSTKLGDSPERFWDRVDMSLGHDGCWPWTAGVTGSGYGRVRFWGRDNQANRVALILSCGSDNGGLVAMHSCDNRICCNPAHLSWGTKKQNSEDMVLKGRSCRGEARARKLSESDVREILSGVAAKISHSNLAARYGVSGGTISSIATRRLWKHITAKDS